MAAAARRSALKVPIRLISTTRSNSASGSGPSRPTMRLAGPMPAQLIRMRAGPCFAAALANAASVALLSVTSQSNGEAVDVARHRRRRPSALTSKIATLAPASASMRAVAAPSPEAPPVTMRGMSSISMFSSLF